MQEYHRAIDAFKSKRSQIQDMQADLANTEKALKVETTLERDNIQNLQILQAKVSSYEKDINDQTVRRDRALSTIIRYAKLLRTARNTQPEQAKEESDFLIRSLRDIGSIVLTELKRMMEKYPEMEEIIGAAMEERGIRAPSRNLSRASSRASSGRDDWSAPPSRAQSRSSIAIGKAPSVPKGLAGGRGSTIIIPNAEESRCKSITNLNGNYDFNVDLAKLPPSSSRSGSFASSISSRNQSSKALSEKPSPQLPSGGSTNN